MPNWREGEFRVPIDREGSVELTVQYRFLPCVPGRRGGTVDHASPPEEGDIEIVRVFRDGPPFDREWTHKLSRDEILRLEDAAWAHAQENSRD